MNLGGVDHRTPQSHGGNCDAPPAFATALAPLGQACRDGDNSHGLARHIQGDGPLDSVVRAALRFCTTVACHLNESGVQANL